MKTVLNQTGPIRKSLVIPVYKNEENIPDLLTTLETLANNCGEGFEVVFVVDGSPDKSHEILAAALPGCVYAVQLVLLSRNFGSFAAIRSGLEYARGDFIAVMAADLQEPPELIVELFKLLEKDAADVIFGQRMQRDDPPVRNFLARSYWMMYQKVIMPDIPRGGVDIFACNQKVRSAILKIEEPNSSLVAQLFWVGFRRSFIPYDRQERKEGESAWSMKKRIRYMLDSIFSYSDFPIMFMLWVGLVSMLLTLSVGLMTVFGKLMGLIDVAGYTTIILVTLFFGSALLTTQGIIGCYLWRTFENTKKRPLSIVQDVVKNSYYD